MFICKNCSTSSNVVLAQNNGICKNCNCKATELPNLSMGEVIKLRHFNSYQLMVDMDKLKQENPIEFQLKYNQMIQPFIQSPQQSNVPRCPTCGSTNIKKISGTKRWVTTGMFGLGSSNVGKTMQCNSCGYKW